MTGSVMLDISGLRPSLEERALIGHPLVGGVILFARNFESPGQLTDLTTELHELKPDLLIAVDHEGGRVQRFRSGFTEVPPMAQLGRLYDADSVKAKAAARAAGFVLAWELRMRGVDLTFAPVLDLDFGRSRVIGNRAFHRDPGVVGELGSAFRLGLKAAGFAAVGKHFPGHGFVEADSHHDLPVDTRPFEILETQDLLPFARLVREGLEGIMPAHVLYTVVDDRPAGFSTFWLQEILRDRLGFGGAIFSDDLSMGGAQGAGSGPSERARSALGAGCDMVLLCNDPMAARQLVEGLESFSPSADSQRRLGALLPPALSSRGDLDARYRADLDLLGAVSSS